MPIFPHLRRRRTAGDGRQWPPGPHGGQTKEMPAGNRHFFSMFHIGGTDGTDSTPVSLSDR
jgi:hypothetical protein